MKKRFTLILGLSILIGVLAAGVYTAVQLLAAPEPETNRSGGGRVMESVMIADGGEPLSVRTTILPAPELPQEKAAAFGIFVRREDDNIIIGTGDIDLDVDVEVDSTTGQQTTSVVPSTNGPELEIVTTHDTIIYKDVTDLVSNQPTESGEREIQQVIKPVDSTDDIGQNAEIEVWGERRGDRIIATVVVFGPLAGGAFE